MQCRHRSSALKKRYNVAGTCARRRSRNQRGMIESAITEPRRIGWNRHECGVATNLVLHAFDRTS